MTDSLRELAERLVSASYEEAQALRPALTAAFESVRIASADGGPELVEALCVVDDPQFELDLLGDALVADPSSELILGAYLTTSFRSGQVVGHRSDPLGRLTTAEGDPQAILRTWDAVLRHLRGLPLPPDVGPGFAAALAEARRALDLGVPVDVRAALL